MPKRTSTNKQEIPEREKPLKSSKRSEHIILVLILLSSFLLLRSTMDPGHAWGGDFALYIEQAIALNNGSIQDLYEQNRYSMDNSPEGFGPYLYPMGFPFLLAPIVKIFGYDLIIMKWLCAAFLLLGAYFSWRLLQDRFSHFLIPLLILAAIATHYQYTLFCDNVLSDLPFFAFVMMSLYLMERAKSMAQWIGIGALIFFTYLIRDIGIFLLPALAAWQWMSIKNSSKPVTNSDSSNEKVDWLSLASPYVVFGILVLISKSIFPSGAENHLAQFFGVELTSNLGYYGEEIDKFLLIKGYESGSSNVLVLRTIVLALFIVGMIKKGQESLHYLVFILLSIILYLLWPFTQGLRFLFPILPFVLLYAFQGLEFLCAKVKVKNLSLYVAVLICAFPIVRSINASIGQAPKDRDMVERAEIQEVFVYINEYLPEEAVVGFHKPRVLRLYTGRNGVFHPFLQYAKVNADYLLVLRGPEKFPLDVVYENEAFLLYRNNNALN